MNCRGCYSWLLRAERLDAGPADVRAHLDGCPACRRRFDELHDLDGRVMALAATPESSRRDRFLSEFLEGSVGVTAPSARPQPAWLPAAYPRPAERGRMRTGTGKAWRALPALAAALLLAALLMATATKPEEAGTPAPQHPHAVQLPGPANTSVEKPPPAPAPITTRQDAPNPPPSVVEKTPLPPVEGHAFLTRVTDGFLELTRGAAPTARTRIFANMLADLHAEVGRSLEVPGHASLPTLSRLFGQVSRQGVLLSWQRLSPAERAREGAKLAADLLSLQVQVAEWHEHAAPAAQPALGEIVQACNELRTRLSNGPATQPGYGAAWETSPPSGHTDLADLVIRYALLTAHEEELLVRVEHAVEVAEGFVRTILHGASEPHDAAQLGRLLGIVMQRGVAVPLESFRPSGPDDPRLDVFDHIAQRVLESLQALERGLMEVPQAARAGIQKALDASKEGRERSMKVIETTKPRKPKGPPFKDKPGPPWKAKPAH
jgi:hypothetical protein